MPAPARKLTVVFGAVGKLEASYGAGGALDPATDSFLIYERAAFSHDYINTGERPAGLGRGGSLPSVAAKGRGGAVELPIEMVGRLSAYSAPVTPPNGLHTMLRASGISAAFSAAPTPQWTYAPETITPSMASATLDLYTDGELIPFDGVVANMMFGVTEANPLRFRFSTFGIPGDPTDVSIPVLTVVGAAGPSAVGLGCTLGLFNEAVIRSIEFDMQREVSANRLDHNSAEGSAGYVGGGRAPRLTVVMEAAQLAPTATPTATQIDPYKMFGSGTTVPITFQVGATQYNKMKFTAPQCTLVEPVSRSEDAPITLWTLVFGCHQSGFGTNDDFELLFN